MVQLDPAPVASSPAPAGAPAADPPAPARALIERQLAMLTRLAEIGMEIAEAAGRQATGRPAASAPQHPEAPPLGDPALAYTRVARAVRMTIALQARLAKDLAALDKAEGQAAAARTARRRARLHRLVERAIEAGPATRQDWDENEIERLSSEAWERLADAGDEGALVGCAPFAEVVAHICQDLRLSPDWTARLLAASGGPAALDAGQDAAGGTPRASPPTAGGAGPPGPAALGPHGAAPVRPAAHPRAPPPH